MENQEFNKTINYIIELIENGMLRLGDKLPAERAISAKLGVSRNLVREAMRSLEALGLIECRQGSGNYLADNLKNTIAKTVSLMLITNSITRQEVFTFRKVMDKTVCSYIIKHGMSPEAKEEVYSTVERMKKAETRNDMISSDNDFHFALLRATENRLWIALIEAVTKIYELWIETMILNADDELMRRMTAVHENILISLINKDEPECMKALDEHYGIIDDIRI